MNDAILVLEDGRVFRGTRFGAEGQTLGEAVFDTGMTGYQEMLTDPGSRGAIVIATAPHIGNTGWNEADAQNPAGRIHAAGLAVREPTRRVSNHRAQTTLVDELTGQDVVGIAGLDTRAVVRHLREHGPMRAGIFSGATLAPVDALLRIVQAQTPETGAAAVRAVAGGWPETITPEQGQGRTVAVLDLGLTRAVVDGLTARGHTLKVLPPTADDAGLDAVGPAGLVISDGPGDGSGLDAATALVRTALGRGLPVLGIGLGHQLLGRVLGLGTVRMPVGHRGANVPVRDLAADRILITVQSHGHALESGDAPEFDTPYGRARISHTSAVDDTVEGVELIDGSALGVQYLPAPDPGLYGPASPYDRFTTAMDRQQKAGQN